MCDPIITGREELGFAKVFSDISDISITEDQASVIASWQGFDFLEMKLSGLEKLDEIPEPNRSRKNDGLLHYKYIPKTGDWGKADIEYPVLSPTSGSNTRLLKSYRAAGALNWNKARWEDLPTLYNIVNTIEALEVFEYTQASLTYSIGSDNLRGQKILS